MRINVGTEASWDSSAEQSGERGAEVSRKCQGGAQGQPLCLKNDLGARSTAIFERKNVLINFQSQVARECERWVRISVK